MSQKKILLTIIDGLGISEKTKGNAFKLAKTPTFDLLMSGKYPYVKLAAAGKSVGLPNAQIGNSEVGHLNIGAGRVIYTGLSRINNAIANNQLNDLETLKEVFKHAKKNSGKVHLMGLLSPGGVHSHEEQIFSLIKIIHENGLTPIMHIFGDGRDVAPKSIQSSIKKLEQVMIENNGKIATISGRFYAMDRDKRWERVKLAYDNILGNSGTVYHDLSTYIEEQYLKNINDEFIEPAHSDANLFLKANDTVIFANFRPDRARELSHLIFGSNYYDYPTNPLEKIYLATLMTYEGIKPSVILFPPELVTNPFGKIIADQNLKQLRIAETEKYAHVTFFFDGGQEIDYPNSKKILIDSPKVRTYDEIPEMAAITVTETLIKLIPEYDVIILNFANPDMVGHTGNLEKTIKSIEVVDKLIKELWGAVTKNDGTMFITADHGNAELMLDDNDNIVTAHSTNDVPFIATDINLSFTSEPAALANVAPTLLEYLGIPIPLEMTAKSILKTNK